MSKQTRRKFNSEFKAKVALEAVKNQQTLSEIGLKYNLSPVVISKWKSELLENMAGVFEKEGKKKEDQGSQYTSSIWTAYLKAQDISISMDGKGRALDNVWIERFWKSIKYDYVYLNPCDDGFELAEGLQNHIEYYNQKVHHTTKRKPNELFKEKAAKKAA